MPFCGLTVLILLLNNIPLLDFTIIYLRNNFFLMLPVGDGWKMIVHKPLEVEVGNKRPKILCVWSGMIG